MPGQRQPPVQDTNHRWSTKRAAGVKARHALRQIRMGFHPSIAARAEEGNDVIVDHVLSKPWRGLDCLSILGIETCCS
ncbi:hypothetical protein [Streptomyces sp. Tu 3180]|uniref:phosphotransferase-like protein n=1 Tax=Streptomyces sp. Tu 3180 TaxID=2682611 RepID=UPI001FB7019B|nr:hypothetical protein [Streptomyces sp. Tu 3180]